MRSARRISWSRSAWLAIGCQVLMVGLLGAQARPTAPPTPQAKPVVAQKPTVSPSAKPAEAKKPGALPAAKPAVFDSAWLSRLKWRELGPAAMGGRIVDLAVVDSDPSTYYVASASGGVFKTTNHGITFAPIFEHEGSNSIGDVGVAPSDPNVVWVGTGEHNPRNSVSWGDGVYKSTDAGKTWKPMGLAQSFQIGRIAIHPTNPDVVFVGALGRLWGDNEERGLFQTTDGGKTWRKAIYIDAKTGCIDVQINPADPNIILAAMYERRRDLFDSNDPAKRWGTGSGLYRSADGGKTWKKITAGLPTVQLGRIGIDFFRKFPKVVYAIVESERYGDGPAPTGARPAEPGYLGLEGSPVAGGLRITRVTQQSPAAKIGLQAGDALLAVDATAATKFDVLQGILAKKKPGDKIKLVVKRGDQKYDVETTLVDRLSVEAARPFVEMLGGQVRNVQERQGPNGYQTGGVYRSNDAGETWSRVNSINPRPYYFSQVRVDPTDDNYVYVLGIDFYASKNGGKTFDVVPKMPVHPDHHALWIDPRDGKRMLLGGDGGLYATYDRLKSWDFHDQLPIGQFYHVTTDTRRPYRVYGGLQDNGSWGGPSLVRGRPGPVNADWATVGWGDGFVCRVDATDPDTVYCESQHGFLLRLDMKRGSSTFLRTQNVLGLFGRFNWNTPFILSHHNPRILYYAGSRVYKSLDRGNKPKVISPNLARTIEGTATVLAESPANADVLWAGTDDGALWVTRDGGAHWTDLTEGLLKVIPGPRYISAVEPARHLESRAYLVLDGHRSNDDQPYVFVTNDFGKTWTSLASGLPKTTTRVLREDRVNPRLLYLGTEFGLYVSINQGQHWARLKNNLPTVAIHEIAQPATAAEIVVATHGRSLWILEVAGLRQVNEQTLQQPGVLFRPAPAVMWSRGPGVRLEFNMAGQRRFVGQNPPTGAVIQYALSRKVGALQLRIDGIDGTIRELPAVNEPGMHAVTWDFRQQGTNPLGALLRGLAGASAPTVGGLAAPGKYKVVLTLDGQSQSADLIVEPDPEFPPSGTLEFFGGDRD